MFNNAYEIMEYNEKTMKYTFVGYATADSPSEAKQVYIKENDWKAKKNTLLFAKPPICR